MLKNYFKLNSGTLVGDLVIKHGFTAEGVSQESFMTEVCVTKPRGARNTGKAKSAGSRQTEPPEIIIVTQPPGQFCSQPWKVRVLACPRVHWVSRYSKATVSLSDGRQTGLF